MALCAIMVTGNICMPEVSNTRNMICALEASSLSEFTSCILSIAFNPQWSGRIDQAEQVGRKAHQDIAMSRVIGWYARENPSKKRPYNTRKEPYSAGFLANIQDT